MTIKQAIHPGRAARKTIKRAMKGGEECYEIGVHTGCTHSAANYFWQAAGLFTRAGAWEAASAAAWHAANCDSLPCPEDAVHAYGCTAAGPYDYTLKDGSWQK